MGVGVEFAVGLSRPPAPLSFFPLPSADTVDDPEPDGALDGRGQPSASETKSLPRARTPSVSRRTLPLDRFSRLGSRHGSGPRVWLHAQRGSPRSRPPTSDSLGGRKTLERGESHPDFDPKPSNVGTGGRNSLLHNGLRDHRATISSVPSLGSQGIAAAADGHHADLQGVVPTCVTGSTAGCSDYEIANDQAHCGPRSGLRAPGNPGWSQETNSPKS